MAEAIPQGFHSVTPFFGSNNPQELIAFMKKGLGAREIYSFTGPDGNPWHTQLQIGDSMIMVGDLMGKPETPLALYIYSQDADAAYQRAIDAGATSVMEMADQFYGDRSGGVKDPFGNTWWFATHVEDVSEADMKERARNLSKQAA